MKRNKYHVGPKERRTYAGRVFASVAECDRAKELTVLLRAGEIKEYYCQPVYHLGCKENTYRADFRVTDKDGKVWVEDVKGCETAKFKHDMKLWRAYGPYPLLVRKRSGKGWKTETVHGVGDTHGQQK